MSRIVCYDIPRRKSYLYKTIFVRGARYGAVKGSVRIVIARVWSWNLQARKGSRYLFISEKFKRAATKVARY